MLKKRRLRNISPIIKGKQHVTFSYKRANELKRFITEQGSILSRERTGLTLKQQRRLAQEIKRARQLALLPFTQTV